MASNSTSGIGKKQGSEKKTGEYEKVFTSKTLGGKGEKTILKGKKNKNGNYEKIDIDKSPTIAGENVSYKKVIGEYKQKAYDSTNNSNIPEGMKDVIKNYFSSLEE